MFSHQTTIIKACNYKIQKLLSKSNTCQYKPTSPVPRNELFETDSVPMVLLLCGLIVELNTVEVLGYREFVNTLHMIN